MSKFSDKIKESQKVRQEFLDRLEKESEEKKQTIYYDFFSYSLAVKGSPIDVKLFNIPLKIFMDKIMIGNTVLFTVKELIKKLEGVSPRDIVNKQYISSIKRAKEVAEKVKPQIQKVLGSAVYFIQLEINPIPIGKIELPDNIDIRHPDQRAMYFNQHPYQGYVVACGEGFKHQTGVHKVSVESGDIIALQTRLFPQDKQGKQITQLEKILFDGGYQISKCLENDIFHVYSKNYVDTLQKK